MDTQNTQKGPPAAPASAPSRNAGPVWQIPCFFKKRPEIKMFMDCLRYFNLVWANKIFLGLDTALG